MAPRKGKAYEQGTSLRRTETKVREGNTRAAGAFITAALMGRIGVYANINSTTGSLRLKLYDNDETYEDTLMAAEDWQEMLGTFAEQLGFEVTYAALLDALASRPAGADSEGRKSRNP